MLYSSPDLTGTDPAYQVTNDVYTVFESGQKIDFREPVYLNSIIITVGNVVFSSSSDWSYVEIDSTSMSKMMTLDPTFNKVLVCGVQINTNTFPKPYTISCTYQQLYQKSMNVNALTPVAPRLLRPDPGETNPDNIVTEPYIVNTFSNQNLIIPVCGAFFGDSVNITLPTNPPTVLSKGRDYIVVGCDVEKTRAALSTAGVYKAILITRPYAGTVSLTYHAYGGEASLGDMTILYHTNIKCQYAYTFTFIKISVDFLYNVGILSKSEHTMEKVQSDTNSSKR